MHFCSMLIIVLWLFGELILNFIFHDLPKNLNSETKSQKFLMGTELLMGTDYLWVIFYGYRITLMF